MRKIFFKETWSGNAFFPKCLPIHLNGANNSADHMSNLQITNC